MYEESLYFRAITKARSSVAARVEKRFLGDSASIASAKIKALKMRERSLFEINF